MATSTEQIHHGKANIHPERGQEIRLFIDLNICERAECRKCSVECDYIHHPGNNGVLSIVELASYALVCRRCEEAHCVKACPVDALEQQPEKDRMLVRHSIRCISCKTCSHACPYGTIYPENVPLMIHVCDFCVDLRQGDNEPLCARTCEFGALRLQSADQELADDDFLVGDSLVVHSTHWMREKA